MYQVILIGVREDIARPEAVNNLAALFQTTTDQVEKILASSRYVLKKGITEEVAGKYRAAIEAAGGACRVESEVFPKQTLDVDFPVSTPIQDTPKNDQKLAQPIKQESLLPLAQQTSANEVVLAMPLEVAFEKVSGAIQQVGKIKRHDRSQQFIEGRIRFGLESVKVHTVLVERT